MKRVVKLKSSELYNIIRMVLQEQSQDTSILDKLINKIIQFEMPPNHGDITSYLKYRKFKIVNYDLSYFSGGLNTPAVIFTLVEIGPTGLAIPNPINEPPKSYKSLTFGYCETYKDCLVVLYGKQFLQPYLEKNKDVLNEIIEVVNEFGQCNQPMV